MKRWEELAREIKLAADANPLTAFSLVMGALLAICECYFPDAKDTRKMLIETMDVWEKETWESESRSRGLKR